MNVWQFLKSDFKGVDVFSLMAGLVLITLPLNFAVNSIAIILLFLISIYNRIFTSQKTSFSSISVLLICLYFLAVFSLLWTENFCETKRGLLSFLSYVVIPISFSLSEKISKERVKKIIMMFAFGIFVLAIYTLVIALVTYVSTQNKEVFFYHQLSRNALQMNAIYLSIFVAFAYFSFLFLDVNKRGKYIVLPVLIVFLVLLSSKTVIITTFFLSSVFLIKKKHLKSRLKIVSIILYVGATALLFGTSNTIQKRFVKEIKTTNIEEVFTKKEFGWDYKWSGTSIRLLQIRIFSEFLYRDKTYIGYGLNASKGLLIKKHKERKIYSKMEGINFHNQYIQVFFELGILGFILLVAIFYVIFKNAIVTKNKLLFSFLFLITIISFTESFLWRQRGMVFFITVAMLLFNKSIEKEKIR